MNLLKLFIKKKCEILLLFKATFVLNLIPFKNRLEIKKKFGIEFKYKT